MHCRMASHIRDSCALLDRVGGCCRGEKSDKTLRRESLKRMGSKYYLL